MIKSYVCSPLSGDLEQNISNAIWYSRYVALKNELPITPHIYFTRFLDDTNAKERKLGMLMGIELMDLCDKMYVFGNITSPGMEVEIDYWTNTGRGDIIYVNKFDFKKCKPKK